MDGGPLRIAYRDEHILVVEKPPGLHTAPLSPDAAGTLLGMVIDAYPEVGKVPGIKDVEPGLLHRLDRETSGLVLVARTAAAFQTLRLASDAGGIWKEYLAVCVPAARQAAPGAPPPRERFRIESRFAPQGPGRRRVRVVPPGARVRAAARASEQVYLTEAEVLETRGKLCLVRARLNRGFRHQVRAHLASVGLPILGDPLYSPAKGGGIPAGAQAQAGRLCLHAWAIQLPHPADGRPVRIESPLPDDVTRLFASGGGLAAPPPLV
jgi:23S rRNA pseudouridine1911/1915/1917 synthase